MAIKGSVTRSYNEIVVYEYLSISLCVERSGAALTHSPKTCAACAVRQNEHEKAPMVACHVSEKNTEKKLKKQKQKSQKISEKSENNKTQNLLAPKNGKSCWHFTC